MFINIITAAIPNTSFHGFKPSDVMAHISQFPHALSHDDVSFCSFPDPSDPKVARWLKQYQDSIDYAEKQLMQAEKRLASVVKSSVVERYTDLVAERRETLKVRQAVMDKFKNSVEFKTMSVAQGIYDAFIKTAPAVVQYEIEVEEPDYYTGPQYSDGDRPVARY